MTLAYLRARRSARLAAARNADIAFDFRKRPGACFGQDDLAVANGPGATVRADINSQLQALGTGQSGTAAPGTTYQYEVWNDTTTGLKKQRNAANSGWIIRGSLAETFVRAKSGTFNVAIGDFDVVFDCTGTYSVGIVAVATALDGFVFVVRNSGTGAITLDPDSSETINGAAALVIASGQSAKVRCNGSAWVADISQYSVMQLLATATASTSATIDFAAGITSDFDEYIVTITDAVPATNNVDLLLRVSEDAGSTFKAGGTDYADSSVSAVDGTATSYGSTGRSSIRLTQEISNAGACSAQVRFSGPSGAQKKKFIFSAANDQNGGTLRVGHGAGMLTLNTTAIDGIRFLMSSGNIASGKFALYGVRKSA